MNTSPKPVKPAGLPRPQPDINLKSDYVDDIYNPFKSLQGDALDIAEQKAIEKAINKALESPILEEHEIQHVLKNPNDSQKIMIEKGKEFFKLNQPLVDEQTKDVVALYSIANKKPFFFITPAEARLVIESVKQNRINIKETMEMDIRYDQIVQTIFGNGILQFRPRKESKPESFTINDVKYNICLNASFKSETGSLSLNMLNQAFAVVEAHDTTVSLLLVNAFTMATIRDWGRTVYDDACAKEIKQKKGYQGHIWTSDIYRCSQLANNEIWLGVIGDDKQVKEKGIDLYQFIWRLP